MTGSLTFEKLVSALYRPTIEYNWTDKNFWKILFYQNKIVVVSGYHAIEISNIPETIKPQGLFYDLQNNSWGKNLEFPVSHQDIENKLNIPVDGYFDAHFNLLLQYCESFTDDIKRKSRLVIAPQVTQEHELVISFDYDENQVPFCSLQDLMFRVSPNSQIRADEVVPHMPYVCVPETQSGSEITVNVLAPGNKIKMGLVFSPGVFWPQSQEEISKIHAMRDMPQQFMFGAFESVNGYMPEATHLDTGMFMDVVKAFTVSEDPIIRFGIGTDKRLNEGAITLESIGPETNVKVKAVVGTLYHALGPQRR